MNSNYKLDIQYRLYTYKYNKNNNMTRVFIINSECDFCKYNDHIITFTSMDKAEEFLSCDYIINDNEAYFPIELNMNLLKDSLEYLNADDLYLNSDGEFIRSIKGMDTYGVNITVDKLNKMVYIDPNPKRTTPMISIPFECITKDEEINTIKR